MNSQKYISIYPHVYIYTYIHIHVNSLLLEIFPKEAAF